MTGTFCFSLWYNLLADTLCYSVFVLFLFFVFFLFVCLVFDVFFKKIRLGPYSSYLSDSCPLIGFWRIRTWPEMTSAFLVAQGKHLSISRNAFKTVSQLFLFTSSFEYYQFCWKNIKMIIIIKLIQTFVFSQTKPNAKQNEKTKNEIHTERIVW